MPARRTASALFALLTLMGVRAPAVLAHHGSEDGPRGMLTVPAGGSAWIPIEKSDPGDTIQWTWTIALASPASPEKLSTQLVWTDSSGQEHAVTAGPPGQAFGTFVAPGDFKCARLVWRNAGEVAAEVHWNYAASAPFWRRPNMFLPALIPVLFLVASYWLGKAIDARARRRRQGQFDVTQG